MGGWGSLTTTNSFASLSLVKLVASEVQVWAGEASEVESQSLMPSPLSLLLALMLDGGGEECALCFSGASSCGSWSRALCPCPAVWIRGLKSVWIRWFGVGWLWRSLGGGGWKK